LQLTEQDFNRKMNSTTKIAGALALLLVAYVGFSSPGKVVITESGDITGIINSARKSMQGKSFWQGQLNAITTRLNKLEAEPAETAKMNREMNSLLIDERREMEKMYQEYPDTRPSEAERQAEALRNKADSIEQAEWDRTMEKERLERIASLRKIYFLVEERAR
jgi:flagellar biosynthesis GTPase FlhF